ncbi:unnamed protein product [Ambrosiozyma monospora]|uniref:Unnamed protein product n=1 Tax=Ambrosiozyma monospora TaxID=43982 RepID=A0ACB5TAQ9_AMBMO|nr:unnamed protein product [Ambrosiozyma monospora]
MSVFLSHLSKFCGWGYVLCWALAAYPTIISNIKLKSVQGISIDYMIFNTMGFFLYSLYTSSMYGSETVREEFKAAHGNYPLIKVNDIFFGIHGVVLNLILISQAYCWGYKKNDNQKPSLVCKVILSCIFVYIIVSSLAIDKFGEQALFGFSWLELFTSLGLIKIAMSVCKNIPQILYNYKRKSTHGWPILMVYFEITGSILSFSQLFIDALQIHHLTSIVKNLPKFLLAIEVFLASVIFFVQHYYLYYNNDVQEYGTVKTHSVTEGYGAAIDEEEEFIAEHEHDHDHVLNVECPVKDEEELHRFLPE